MVDYCRKPKPKKIPRPGPPVRFWDDRKHEPPTPPPGYEWYFLRNRKTGMVKLGLCRLPGDTDVTVGKATSDFMRQLEEGLADGSIVAMGTFGDFPDLGDLE
ncbi:hypothetical protein ES703_116227 [subsurface metagenome]